MEILHVLCFFAICRVDNILMVISLPFQKLSSPSMSDVNLTHKVYNNQSVSGIKRIERNVS